MSKKPIKKVEKKEVSYHNKGKKGAKKSKKR